MIRNNKIPEREQMTINEKMTRMWKGLKKLRKNQKTRQKNKISAFALKAFLDHFGFSAAKIANAEDRAGII